MKDLKAIKGRVYLLKLVEEGEHEHQDFKFVISDARKIARSISAFANNDGGRLLIGVKDSGVIAGVRNEEDIYMIETAASVYCKPEVEVAMKAYRYDAGVVVFEATIPKALRPPVMVVEEGNQLKAYYRVKDENIVAPPLLMRAWHHYSNPAGAKFEIDEHYTTLMKLIREREAITIDEFVVESHLSTEAATDFVARLAAASAVNLRHDGTHLLICF